MMDTDQIRASGNKKTNLLNPGSVESDFYYSSINSRVNPIEAVKQCGAYKVSLSAPVYGGMSTVQVNNQNLVGKVYLTIGLKRPAGAGIANISLPKGWCYRLIRSVDVLIGNSNISTQTFNQAQSWHVMNGQCSSASELDYYLQAGGSQLLGSAYTGVAIPDYLFVDGYTYGTILIDVPWSSWCTSLESKLYFDTSLLNQPITLNIRFNDYQELFGSTYVPPVDERTFQSTMYYSELIFSNKEQGLRDTLRRTPDMLISYPSIYKTPGSGDIIINPTVANNGAFSVNLQGFLDSDLLGLSLSFQLQEELVNTAGPNNFFNCLDVLDLKLQFSGHTIIDYPIDSYKLIQQESSMMPVFATNVVSRIVGGLAKYGARQSYVIQISLTRLSALCGEAGYMSQPFQNSQKIPNQILTLTGRIPQFYHFVDQNSVLQSINCWDKVVVLKQSQLYPSILVIDNRGNVNIWYS